MKYFVFIFFCLFTHCLLAQNQKIVTINKHEFLFKESTMKNDDGEFKFLSVHRIREKQSVLNHVLFSKESDCNSQSLQLGAYKLDGDSLILYSYWAWIGDAPISPFGVRKQVYQVSDNYNILLKSGLIYLEIGREGEPSEQIKKDIESEYQATFIIDQKQKISLFEEVTNVLKSEIEENTSSWKDWDTSFGYKK